MPLSPSVKEQIRNGYERLAKAWPGFRARAGQRQMIADVAAALGDSDTRLALLEGPCGTGKSLAYMVGAIPVAQERELPMVIATGTIALQQQLVERDLPELLRVTGWPGKVRVAKGRSRYVCARELARVTGFDPAQTELGFAGEDSDPVWRDRPSGADTEAVRQMASKLADRSWDGDLDRWSDRLSPLVLAHVTTTRHACGGQACPHYNGCALRQHRAGLLDPDSIVVTNHALLLTDLATGHGMLKDASRYLLIVDEAHHLAQTATKQLGRELDVLRSKDALERDAKRAGQILQGLPSGTDRGALIDPIFEAYRLLPDVLGHLGTALRSTSSEHREGARSWRMSDEQVSALDAPMEELRGAAMMLDRQLARLRLTILQSGKDGAIAPEKANNLARRLAPALEHSGELLEVATRFCQRTPEGAPPIARWQSAPTSADRLPGVGAGPIAVGGWLRAELWDRTPGAVLTSATLSMLGGFGPVREALGLSRTLSVQERALPQVFDLAQQAVVRIPWMDTDPKCAQEHLNELCARLPMWLREYPAGGRLILCTSAKQRDAIAAALRAQGIVPRIQGQAPLSDLLLAHRADVARAGSPVLLGLSSFAEGLDLPGTDCMVVIIAKLPFAVPDDPIEETRERWLSSMGRSYFREVAVPMASLRLVQGCGRLVRSEKDRGHILIADRRLVTTPYGQRIWRTLPPYARRIDAAEGNPHELRPLSA